MSPAYLLRSTATPADESCPGNERARRGTTLSSNAQAWRRLARDGYGRTAERVRASQGSTPRGPDLNAPR
ncbi:hypothetical protein [uncultured Rhodoferax sp.]|uniref:hypothetical protein n=1 Tax=uncultured Rhodoferax sp. TaxID=223188 RepID=UPI0025E4C5D7|nr:hypothetical protein [uncultured Rhodoferax sp.]